MNKRNNPIFVSMTTWVRVYAGEKFPIIVRRNWCVVEKSARPSASTYGERVACEVKGTQEKRIEWRDLLFGSFGLDEFITLSI